MHDRTKLPLNVGDQIWVNMPTKIVNGHPFTDTDKCDIVKIEYDDWGDEILYAKSCESTRKYKFDQEQIYKKNVCKVITPENYIEMFKL